MISRMPWTIRLISNQHWCEWKVEVQVKKTNFHVSLSHQRSVTVSVETRNLFKWKWCLTNTEIIYNYPRKGRWIVVDIYQDVKRRGIYQLLFTDPEGDSCFSIYQIRWIKKTLLQFLLLKLSRNDAPLFSPFAKQWISKDILSYRSQSKRAKIAIHWFEKYYCYNLLEAVEHSSFSFFPLSLNKNSLMLYIPLCLIM